MNLSELIIPSASKLLVVVPHPDDEAIGCSGLISQHISAGGQVKLVLVTDGDRRNKGEIRRGELLSSLEIIGMQKDDLIRFDIPDGMISQYFADFCEKIEEVLKQYQPDVIISTDPSDRHKDHRVLGKWAWEQNSKAVKVYTFLAHHRLWPAPFGKKPQAFLLPPKAQQNRGIWYTLTLSQDAKKRKYASIMAHDSQHHILLHLLLMSFWRVNELFRSPAN